MIRNDATEAQVQAADPNASTWLAANAGSGKTRVLTDRVARLLLNGVEPQKVLCLTYTKAAASEMQNRLFQRLGGWAMLPDAQLARALDELGVEHRLDAGALRQARTLFARAIETPGGLKIQTIHSFCAGLLRRFPLEAGVSPQFTEIEDRAATLLRGEIVDDLAEGDHAALVANVARHLGGSDLDHLTHAIASRREAFDQPQSRAGLMAAFGLPPDLTQEDLTTELFLGGEDDLIRRLIPVMEQSGVTDQKLAARLKALVPVSASSMEELESIFLTGASAKDPFTAKLGKIPAKGAKAPPDLHEETDRFMDRIEATRARRIALKAAGMAHDLHQFSAVFLQEYDRRKLLHGWLDFDDLIIKSRQLLNDQKVAQWVLYRLDGGIDHILVDEAQDTSPAQWDVVEKLSQEFTSGLGARSQARSIFVVGDKKQSIYSFQGADPGGFDRMRDYFAERLQVVGQHLSNRTLQFSFRSSHAILAMVDTLFEGQVDAGFDSENHIAFKSALPGRVDLWPALPPAKDDTETPWYTPLDRPSPKHHTVELAEQIAAEIKRMIDTGTLIPEDEGTARPVRSGDFLILVQRRSALFAEIIRACKAQGLPIAGSDRLKVGAELAVKDLAALLSFLATPEDDLSLATALKSPLFGWSEQQLFDLAHRRAPKAFLWQTLRDRAAEFPDTLAVLNDLRNQADFLRPYDLIEHILIRHGGRQLLLGRLGHEAEDGINALLSQALAYERSEVPSLTGFLVWMQTDDLEIRRQIDSEGNMIRVMTVHGAKGLEAPIVILPDTAKRRAGQKGNLVMAGDIPLWRLRKEDAPDLISTATSAEEQREEEERLRLLYVALTRAEKWLIVAAAGELDEKNGNTWYQRVEAAMLGSGAVDHAFPIGDGKRIETGEWAGLAATPLPETTDDTPSLPAHFRAPAPAPSARQETKSPSDLGGAKALPGDAGLEEEAAKLRGTQIHLLLEHLPRIDPAQWSEKAAQILSLPEPAAKPLLTEAAGVLQNDQLKHLFDPTTLAEVSITADMGEIRIHGTIDRLIITENHILAVDFKTNATVPAKPEDTPEGLLRQMAAYAHGLAQTFPDHRIDTAILWTRTAQLMHLPHDIVTDAGKRVLNLDDA
ncbi:double-strand break repair helicase AddA [Aestuariivita boseongensis]|uniref:double-strand break repair helicase AddA n=1 Tax=Aestuariivita boseongensis TaxID=1470562 RepID=UPI000682EA42|nr:double-strand break repair helicase AddA [Aestuariivita boseongensis]